MIDQDLPPVVEKVLLKTASFKKAVSTSHIIFEIHAAAVQSIQSSQMPPTWLQSKLKGFNPN